MCWQGSIFKFHEMKLKHFTEKAGCYIESQNTRRNRTTFDNIFIYTEICVRNTVSVKNHTLFSIRTRLGILLIMRARKISPALKGDGNWLLLHAAVQLTVVACCSAIVHFPPLLLFSCGFVSGYITMASIFSEAPVGGRLCWSLMCILSKHS